MQRALGGGLVQRYDGALDSLFGVIEVAIVDVLSRGPYERSDTGPPAAGFALAGGWKLDLTWLTAIGSLQGKVEQVTIVARLDDRL